MVDILCFQTNRGHQPTWQVRRRLCSATSPSSLQEPPGRRPVVGEKARCDHGRQIREDCELFGCHFTLSLDEHWAWPSSRGLGPWLRLAGGASDMRRPAPALFVPLCNCAKRCAAQIPPGGGLKSRIFCLGVKSWIPRVAGDLSQKTAAAPPPAWYFGNQYQHIAGSVLRGHSRCAPPASGAL